jgi:anthranilate 1,2-dioxygenase small subunit
MSNAITLERILALQAAYIRCIDNNALESWPDFFLDRCLYVVTSTENHKNGFEGGIIYADTKGMLMDRIAALREANVYEKQAYRHILGLPNVTRNDGNSAESETPFMVVRVMHDGKSDIFATGVYLDTYQVDGTDLKFAKRLAVCDSSRVDTLMALPL